MPRNNVYANVTNRILEQLEKGVAPWVKPWDGGLPTNAHRGTAYSGVNVLALWGAAMDRGYSDNRWATYNQAKKLGGHVKKGEKGTKVVFAKNVRKRKEDENGKEYDDRFFLMKEYTVFNVEQCVDLDLEEPPRPDIERSELLERTGASIHYMGHRAAYNPARDIILMPKPHTFESEDAYLSTGFHELGHWTGNEKRLNRDLTGRFGTSRYAAEELIAELTAAFLCASYEVESQLQHASYIGSWIKLLREDEKAIFTASRRAEEAAEFIRERVEKSETAGEEVEREMIAA